MAEDREVAVDREAALVDQGAALGEDVEHLFILLVAVTVDMATDMVMVMAITEVATLTLIALYAPKHVKLTADVVLKLNARPPR